jgi:PAS domain S-box-containing protein
MIERLMMITTNAPPLTDSHRFERLVGAIADYAIYLLDPDGSVISWNKGAEIMSGYPADEGVGRHFSDLFTAEDRAAGLPEKALSLARETGHYQSDGWRVRKDGGRVRCNTVLQTVLGDRGELLGFGTITRDTPERIEAQKLLRQSERRVRMLVDYALYMMSPAGIVTDWNLGSERLSGYPAEEIVGQHFSVFYTKADRAAGRPEQALAVVIASGRFESEGWRVRKDGTLFWANWVIDAVHDATGAVIGLAKITRDVTERREAQLALQEVQAQRAHAQKMEALGQLTGGVAHDFNNLLMVVSGHIYAIKSRIGDDPKLQRAVAAIETASERGGALTRQLLSFSRRQTFTPTVVDLAELIKTVGTMLESAVDALIEIDVTIDPDTWPINVDAG